MVAGITFCCLPYYARQALIHWYPTIDDLTLFHRHTVHAPDSCWDWYESERYNTYRLEPEDSAYLTALGTVSFLVIRNDSILYERYFGGWNDSLTSNLYSCTKTIVGLLVGVGQYIIAIPSRNAIVVRLGHKRSDVYVRELTTDIIRYMDVAMKILEQE